MASGRAVRGIEIILQNNASVVLLGINKCDAVMIFWEVVWRKITGTIFTGL
jgi:hypothetical protein